MRILLSSHCFRPSVGGIETVSALLAEAFVKAGHEVTVLTRTPGDGAEPATSYGVVRGANFRLTRSLLRKCDVFFQNNISLQTAVPLLTLRKPWVTTFQTWVARVDGTMGWQDRLKRWLYRFLTPVAISRAVAEHLPGPSVVIPNPYDDSIFYLGTPGRRARDIVFVGRLVSDKGADLLLEAVARLKAKGWFPSVTIVGGGPEEASLRERAESLGVSGQVVFTGARSGSQVADSLRAHEILVVPSRWKEPFGIVAAEGMACGCVAVGSAGGGLPEAIGPGGMTFPNGDVEALAACLERLLRDPEVLENYRRLQKEHLKQFQPSHVVQAYLRVFQSAIDGEPSPGSPRNRWSR